MFIDFEKTHFTVITDDKGEPWFIAKEICDYLERGRDTLLRQVGSLTGKWHLFWNVKSECFFWISLR